ncbi:Double-stranded beta-helix fold enzyme [Nitrosotalea sinensis]|jgi:quercetin dioxygenase-like cupin family protein|uniref:Double-stranded beta-helix fold enzyme n=1 Tax=Nitrosotalea sinensis TaxID=1499975 RepID=A0A2H1EHY9_9ARCH|nr:cupin domain-containing protein [Candidatus Nitrosotalea sinensis]SHO46957.1 Double-stranded beta-helix fold enzyme [Candidatus Nitrosotalea sinensis]
MNKKIIVSKLGPDKQLVQSKKQYFVGNAWLNDISLKLKITGQKVYFANFSNGARTKVHYHQGGQILVVTTGKGMLVFYKKVSMQNNMVKIKKSSQVPLGKGDVVFIPKNTLHWHGALKGNNLAHIAFNLFANGKESKTIWYDSDFMSYATKIK